MSVSEAGVSARAAGDDILAHDVRIAVMRLARRLRSEGTDNRLTVTQVSALATLERHGPMTAGALAGREHVRPPSMTRVIATLSAEGFLNRAPHPTDGRQCLVSISPRGSAWLRDNRRQREAWLARELQALTAADRAALRAAVPVCEALAGR